MPMESRYIDNEDGTVTDNATGLMWTKKANHGLMTWSDAVAYCDNLMTNGYCDWRLPLVAHGGGKAELDALFRANGNPPEAWEGSEETPFDGVQDTYYWSSTSLANSDVYAWVVNMSNGYVNYFLKTFNFHCVWPVRGGQ